MVLNVIKSENIYKIHEKYYVMAINQHLWNIALNLPSIQEKFYQFANFFFHAIQSTKHLVHQVSADCIGYYMQGSGKSDKYGFSMLLA